MKKKHTEKKSANRGPSKTQTNSIQRMPVIERRRMGFRGPDAADYDARHGVCVL